MTAQELHDALSGSSEQHHCLSKGLAATAGATNEQHKRKTRNSSRAQPAHDTRAAGARRQAQAELSAGLWGVRTPQPAADGVLPEPPPQETFPAHLGSAPVPPAAAGARTGGSPGIPANPTGPVAGEAAPARPAGAPV